MEMFTRTEVEMKRMMEEEKELDDFERRQEEVRERELLERLEAEKRSVTRKASAPVSQKNSQLKLLAGAVKRRNDKEEESRKKVRSDETSKPEKSGQKGSLPSLLGLADYGSDSESE